MKIHDLVRQQLKIQLHALRTAKTDAEKMRAVYAVIDAPSIPNQIWAQFTRPEKIALLTLSDKNLITDIDQLDSLARVDFDEMPPYYRARVLRIVDKFGELTKRFKFNVGAEIDRIKKEVKAVA